MAAFTTHQQRPAGCGADVVVPSGSEALRPSTTAPLLGRWRLPQPHRLRKQHGYGARRNLRRVDSRTAGTMQQSATRDETTPPRSKRLPSGWLGLVPDCWCF
ncbi:MAG: hypothetical protein WA633_28155, partial [Stellaceae bacterium]